jgi:hypothetical protein
VAAVLRAVNQFGLGAVRLFGLGAVKLFGLGGRAVYLIYCPYPVAAETGLLKESAKTRRRLRPQI